MVCSISSVIMDKEIMQKLWLLLPTTEEVEELLHGHNDNDDAKLISWAIDDLKRTFGSCGEVAIWDLARENAFNVIRALIERCWERIHTGKFCDIAVTTRKTFALSNYFKICYLLMKSVQTEQLEECMETLDLIDLLGVSRESYARCIELHEYLETYLNDNLGLLKYDLPPLDINYAPFEECKCDVDFLYNPSVDIFESQYFRPGKPLLVRDFIEHWPAVSKWRNLNYLLKVAGHRSMPVEMGHNYTDSNWSQRMVKFRDFLQRQFSGQQPDETHDIEYLAQHELFDQIPALRRDIIIPEYCVLGSDEDITASLEMKAWLGPKGTVSPLHYDAKHNILCQVFGAKTVLLAAPAETDNMYAHDSELLSNTSRIVDAENINLVEFPKAANIRFYQVPLIESSCLYIPPKWWHYVRADTASFSVSFWWE